jgi:hypothetical protein
MNPGDSAFLRELAFEIFSRGDAARLTAASQDGRRILNGRNLDSPRPPYRCQPPESRKVAHYTSKEAKTEVRSQKSGVRRKTWRQAFTRRSGQSPAVSF